MARLNCQVAQAFAPIVVVLMILFGGFYINVDSLPVWLAWLQYLSIMRWAFMGLAVNEFTGATFSCSGRSLDFSFCQNMHKLSLECF